MTKQQKARLPYSDYSYQSIDSPDRVLKVVDIDPSSVAKHSRFIAGELRKGKTFFDERIWDERVLSLGLVVWYYEFSH